MASAEPTEEQKYERAKRRVFGGTFILLALFAAGIYYAVRKTAHDAAMPARVIAVEPFQGAGVSRELAAGLADLAASRIAEGESIRVIPMHATLSGARVESDFVIGGTLRRDRAGWHLLVRVSDGSRTETFDLSSPTLTALDEQMHSRVVKVASPSSRHEPHGTSEDSFRRYLEARGRIASRDARGLDEAITLLAAPELSRSVSARGLRAYALALRALSEPAEQRIEAARIEGEAVEASSPGNLDALEAIAIAGMLADEGWDRVFETTGVVVARAPGRDLAHLARATAYLHMGLIDFALLEAGMARVANPALDLPADRIEATARLYRGDSSGIRNLFDEKGRRSAADLVLMAQAALIEQDVTTASRLLRRAINEAPDSYAPRALLRSLNPPNVSDRKLELAPQTHHDLYAAGVLAAANGRWGEASQWLTKAATSGFAPLAWYEHDPSLARLRQQKEFEGVRRTVVGEVKKAQNASRAVPRK